MAEDFDNHRRVFDGGDDLQKRRRGWGSAPRRQSKTCLSSLAQLMRLSVGFWKQFLKLYGA
jgi:hypothetical protein